MRMRALTLVACVCFASQVFAQTNTFPSSGNVGVGTTTPSTLFQVNGGTAQFGGAINYARILVDGDLTFTGTADYLVGAEKYAFRYSGNQNFGLLFSAANSRYEFRDGSGVPVLWISGNGNGYVKNRLHIGSQAAPTATLELTPTGAAAIKINPYGAFTGNTGELRMMELQANGTQYVGFKAPSGITTSRIYTLPAADGIAGYILSTNGAGDLSWIPDANTVYTAGAGLNLIGNTFSNTQPDQIVTLAGGGMITISGTYPSFGISATEADPIFNAAPAATITLAQINDWNTAYGWGNHATAGYLTSYSETDPVFASAPAATITNASIYDWNTAYGWGDHATAGYLTSFTETDPVFASAPAATITNASINDWNTAYGWGDHATAGYLTSFTETDPQINSTTLFAIPKWDGSALVDGSIYDNGTNVGIGTSTPGFKLEVTDDILINGIPIGKGAGTSQYNVRMGQNNLYMNTSGEYNTAIGTFALMRNTTGNTNTAIGYAAQYYRISGSANTAIGNGALYDNAAGNYNTAIGEGSGRNNQGSSNVFIGYYAGFDEMGSNKLYIANNNVNPPLIYGDFASERIGLGTITPDAKLHVAGSIKIADGTQGNGKVLTSDANGLASWQNVAYTETDPQVNSATTNMVSKWSGTALVDGSIYDDGMRIGIGTTTPAYKLEVTEDVLFNSIRVGRGAGNDITNTALGYQAMQSNVAGGLNISVAIGYNALKSATSGSNNTGIGASALESLTSGSYNTGIGTGALAFSISGNQNTAVGRAALWANTDGSNNTAVGLNALMNNQGSDNVSLGFCSGFLNYAGNGNVFIGNYAGYNETGSNKLYIANSSANPPLIYGDFSSSRIGFNNNNPAYSVDMNIGLGSQGALRVYAGPGGNGRIFIGDGDVNHGMTDFIPSSDVFGNLTAASDYGGLGVVGASATSGVSGIVLAAAIGSTDPSDAVPAIQLIGHKKSGTYVQALGASETVLGVRNYNGANSFVITGNGNVGINNISPGAVLDVSGNIKIADGTQGNGKVLTSDANGLASWQNVAYTETDPQVNSTVVNKIPKWNGTALTDGLIYDDGDKIGIGTSTPSQKLEVAGNAKINGVMVGSGNGGEGNAVLGNGAYINNYNGNNNTAIGNEALKSNIYGSYNAGIGTSALIYNTSGNGNAALGCSALVNNNGSYNTASGHQAMFYNTSGGSNTASGLDALFYNTLGSYNTATGNYALFNVTTGNYNTAIGSNTNVTSGTLENATAVGYAAVVDASNKVRIGNTYVNSIGGEVGWTSFSDERMKKDIRNDVPGLAFINKLNPVTYHIDSKKQVELMGISDTTQWTGKADLEKIQFTGFLAQDVDAAAQSLGYDFSGIDKSGAIMGLRYGDFVVPLTKAVQELDMHNTNQDAQILMLQETIDLMQQQINTLMELVSTSGLNDGAAEISIGEKDDQPMLGQNIPNPYDQTTLIPFRVPENCNDAYLMITDPSAGRVITVIPISCNATHVVFAAAELPSGMYSYSLFVDGQMIDTKQMILTR